MHCSVWSVYKREMDKRIKGIFLFNKISNSAPSLTELRTVLAVAGRPAAPSSTNLHFLYEFPNAVEVNSYNGKL